MRIKNHAQIKSRVFSFLTLKTKKNRPNNIEPIFFLTLSQKPLIFQDHFLHATMQQNFSLPIIVALVIVVVVALFSRYYFDDDDDDHADSLIFFLG